MSPNYPKLSKSQKFRGSSMETSSRLVQLVRRPCLETADQQPVLLAKCRGSNPLEAAFLKSGNDSIAEKMGLVRPIYVQPTYIIKVTTLHRLPKCSAYFPLNS